MTVYSISEVEKITGIKSHNLRIWEKRYSLALSKRKDTNIRFYDDGDLKFLLQTSNLLEAGYKISKVASMNEEERLLAVDECMGKCNDHSLFINQLTIAMLELNEQLFHNICYVACQKMGVEGMMFSIIYPFLERIGLLWVTNRVNPAHEHFITHLIRQKLIAAIDNLPVPSSNTDIRYLLFLPEGELHEVSLLLLNFILRSRGNHSLYLGQNTPFEDIRNSINYYNPTYICTLLTSAHKTEIDTLMMELSEIADKTTIMVAGRQVSEIDIKDYPLITFLFNPSQVIDWVENNQVNANKKMQLISTK